MPCNALSRCKIVSPMPLRLSPADAIASQPHRLRKAPLHDHKEFADTSVVVKRAEFENWNQFPIGL